MIGSNSKVELLRDFEVDGFVALPQFVGGEELSELLVHVDRFLCDVIPQLPPEQVFFEHKDDPATLKQIQHMDDHDPWFHELFTASPFRDVAELFLQNPVMPKNLQYFNKPPGVGQPTPPQAAGKSNAKRPTSRVPKESYEPMKSLLSITIGLIAWAAALFGVLQIGLVSEQSGHTHDGISICGPWGCGPPLRTLIGWHGFWFVLVAPPVGLLIQSWPAKSLRLVGLGLTAVGLLTLIGIGIYEAVNWLPQAADGGATYFVRRYLFSIATLTDVPVIPVTLAGLAMSSSGFIKARVST